MSGEWINFIETMEIAKALRNSAWAYPLVNAGHIFGVALFVGGMVPLDLRLSGVWKSLSLRATWRILTRTTGAGAVLIISCGLLLFMTRASEYIQSAVFLSKMAVIAAGIISTLVLYLSVMHEKLNEDAAGNTIPVYIRAVALLSLAIWPTALLLGRLIGYF